MRSRFFVFESDIGDVEGNIFCGHPGSGGAGLEVYEEEEGVLFQDLSESGLQDDVLARLITFPNVIITSHQAFLTKEALKAIAETMLLSLTCEEIAPGKRS